MQSFTTFSPEVLFVNIFIFQGGGGGGDIR